VLLPLMADAQEFVRVSYGQLYTTQTFFTLSDCSETTLNNEDWHIALTATGFTDAGIHFNESATFMADPIQFFVAPTSNFDDVIDQNEVVTELFNPDSSWNEGAFNSLRVKKNPLDYGWGSYNPATMTVEGNEVFVMKFRRGGYIKIQIESLALTTYTIKWADLDGGNEKKMVVDKQAYRDNDILLIDLFDEKVIPSPAGCDLFFTRYNTPLDDNMGGILNYNVTGALHMPGVQVAQADDVDTEKVMFDKYIDSLEDERIDIIGQDWKEFDITARQWKVTPRRAYFVKDQQGDVYKVIFIDFEGSSTGNIVFSKEKVGTVSTVDQLSSVDSWLVYPNPVSDRLDIAIEANTNQEVVFNIIDLQGKVVSTWTETLISGMIISSHDVHHLSPGQYQVILSTEEGRISTPLTKI